MNPKLQAGVELVIEKTAAEEAGVGLLANSLFRKAAAAGILSKKAAEESGKVEETGGEGASKPSSATSDGMEDKNQQYGKGAQYKLDDDPSKGGKETGTVQNSTAGKTETLETDETGDKVKDALKEASGMRPNARIMANMIRGLRR